MISDGIIINSDEPFVDHQSAQSDVLSSSSPQPQNATSTPPKVEAVVVEENAMDIIFFGTPLAEFEHEEVIEDISWNIDDDDADIEDDYDDVDDDSNNHNNNNNNDDVSDDLMNVEPASDDYYCCNNNKIEDDNKAQEMDAMTEEDEDLDSSFDELDRVIAANEEDEYEEEIDMIEDDNNIICEEINMDDPFDMINQMNAYQTNGIVINDINHYEYDGGGGGGTTTIVADDNDSILYDEDSGSDDNIIYNDDHNDDNIIYNDDRNDDNIIYSDDHSGDNNIYNDDHSGDNIIYNDDHSGDNIIYNEDRSDDGGVYFLSDSSEHTDQIEVPPATEEKLINDQEIQRCREQLEGGGGYTNKGVYRVSVIQKAPQTTTTTFGNKDEINILPEEIISAAGNCDITESEIIEDAWNGYTLTCLPTLKENLINPVLLSSELDMDSVNNKNAEEEEEEEGMVLHYSETSSVAVLKPVTEHNVEDTIAYNCSQCNEKLMSFKELSNHLRQHSINDWLAFKEMQQQISNKGYMPSSSSSTVSMLCDDSTFLPPPPLTTIAAARSAFDNSSSMISSDLVEATDIDIVATNTYSSSSTILASTAITTTTTMTAITADDINTNNNIAANGFSKDDIGNSLGQPTAEICCTENDKTCLSVGSANEIAADTNNDNNNTMDSGSSSSSGGGEMCAMNVSKLMTSITMDLTIHNQQKDTRDVAAYVKTNSTINLVTQQQQQNGMIKPVQVVTTYYSNRSDKQQQDRSFDDDDLLLLHGRQAASSIGPRSSSQDFLLPNVALDMSKTAPPHRNNSDTEEQHHQSLLPPIIVKEDPYQYDDISTTVDEDDEEKNDFHRIGIMDEYLSSSSNEQQQLKTGSSRQAIILSSGGDCPISDNTLECIYCNNQFANKDDLLNHLGSHFIHQCDRCLERFETVENLQKHVITSKCTHHDILLLQQQQQQQIKDVTLFECSYCGEQIIGSVEHYNQHVKSHIRNTNTTLSITTTTTTTTTKNDVIIPPPRPPVVKEDAVVQQEQCKKIISSMQCKKKLSSGGVGGSSGLLTKKPCIGGVGQQSGMIIECKVCERTFTRKQDLKHHERFHFPGRVYRCSFCSISLISRDAFDKHIKQHAETVDNMQKNNRYLFRCAYCENITFNLEQLTAHMDVHLPKGTYECSECRLRFRHKETFKSHMRGHVLRDNARIESTSVLSTSADKKIIKDWGVKCNFCTAVFTSQAERNRHTKRHEDDVNSTSLELLHPSDCIYCQSKLETISDIIRHIRMHTEERKQFPCSICDRKVVLEKTEATHEPGNAYYCNYCIQKMKESQPTTIVVDTTDDDGKDKEENTNDVKDKNKISSTSSSPSSSSSSPLS